MSIIIFKTEEAIFQFNQNTVMERLKNRKTSYQINELDTLIDVLRNQPEQTILSLAEHKYFGHIAINMIDASEGSAFCKNCGKRYRSNQLEAFTVGPDEATFRAASTKKGGFKGLFRKKPIQFAMYSGKGVKCPHGHMLIFMVTWIT